MPIDLRKVVRANWAMCVTLASIVFMGLLPYGSFNPTSWQFYVCILQGFASVAIGYYLYDRLLEVRLTIIVIYRIHRIMRVMLLSIVLMYAMPRGSFDLANHQFYFSILNAVIIDTVIFYVLKRMQENAGFRLQE